MPRMRDTAMLRTLLLLLASACLLAGCGAPPSADVQAQAFWDAVADGRSDDAAALTTQGDDARARLARLEVKGAKVEPLEVPDIAGAAHLPTHVSRDGAEDITTTTVLVRTEDGWRVDAEQTLGAYRTASVEAVGERLAGAAGRLGDAFGRTAGDLGDALGAFGETLGELISEEGERSAEELEAELGRRLEEAGEAIARGLEDMERALEEAEAARRREEESST